MSIIDVPDRANWREVNTISLNTSPVPGQFYLELPRLHAVHGARISNYTGMVELVVEHEHPAGSGRVLARFDILEDGQNVPPGAVYVATLPLNQPTFMHVFRYD